MLATAANQLMHLHHKFRLANSARADLDIVEPITLGRLSANLAMNVAHFLDRAVVVIPTVNKRHDHLGEIMNR